MTQLSWRMREPLNLAWTGEYVFLDAPEAAGRSVPAVTDGTRIFAAQYDPARKALAVRIDLQPLQELTLRPADGPPPPTALAVEQRAGVCVIRNKACAFSFAAQPAVSDAGDRWAVPGPLAALIGPDGLHRCASRISVRKSRFFDHDRDSIGRVDPAKIAAEQQPPAVTAGLVESGPVFATWRYTLTMFDGRSYSFTATLFAEQPVLYVREETDLGRDGDVEYLVSEGFGCDHYFHGGAGGGNAQRFVPLPPGPYRLGSLTPHHVQFQTAHPWIGFAISNRPQGTFRGICENDLVPYADTITFMAHNPTQWRYPADVTLQFECREGRQAVARGPLRRGLRTWCLIVLHRNELAGLHRFRFGAEARETSPLALWHRRINDIPLDWLRRLDLESGALADGAPPQSVLAPAELAGKQRGIFPRIAELLHAELAGTSQSHLYARWMLLGDRQAARRLADTIIASTEGKLALFANSGFLADSASAVANRHLGPDAVYYEACVAAGVLTAEEKKRLHTLMLFFAYATEGDALFPSHTNYLPPDHPLSIRNWATLEQYSDVFGTPNFQTDVYYNLGLYGAVFTGHPKSRAWMAEAASQLDQQLDAHFHPGGVYKEAPGYFAHLFHNMLSLASVLKRHGIRDFYADRRFQDAMGCFVDYLGAPRRATIERIVSPGRPAPAGLMRFWPGIGDTGHNCAEFAPVPLLAHAAWEVREHDAGLSDRLLAAWNDCGRPLWGVHAPMFEFLYIRDLAPKAAPLRLASRNFVNIGPVLRADVGEPTETSIFVRSGRATHHWGFDHGHFTVTTRGSLLIPDFGYHGSTLPAGGAFVHGSATWVHNVVTFGPWWNGDIGMERRAAERAIVLGGDFDYVVCDLSLNSVRVNNWRNIRHIAPIEYFRHLLFAHNRYILVWDRIQHSVYSSQLRIHCLAKSVAADGSQARFAGLDGVDLAVRFIAPERPELHEGIVGPQRYLLLEQDCQKDYVWLCQPLGPGEEEFHVECAPDVIRISGTDLRGAKFEDIIVYRGDDFGALADVGGRRLRLDGRLAVLHRDASGESAKLLDAKSLA